MIGGFEDLDNDEAEKLVSDALCDVPGFQFAHTTTSTPTVTFAECDAVPNAMTRIRMQKINQKMIDNKLWAPENRSPMERRRCKLISKMNDMFIDYDACDPGSAVDLCYHLQQALRVSMLTWKFCKTKTFQLSNDRLRFMTPSGVQWQTSAIVTARSAEERWLVHGPDMT